MVWNGGAIFGEAPDLVVELYASLLDWGQDVVHFNRRKWMLQEKEMHINHLELLAGQFAVKCFVKERAKCCVLLKMDKVPAVRYINKLGGPRSRTLAELV